MFVQKQRFSSNQVKQVLSDVLGEDLHAKRVASLSDATLGVLRSASLAVCAIGRGLAAARSLNPKHATKQVDRLLSNPKINVDDILVRWVPYVIGARSSVVVALDCSRTTAASMSTECWCGWPNYCRPISRCAWSPTAASATRSCTGC